MNYLYFHVFFETLQIPIYHPEKEKMGEDRDVYVENLLFPYPVGYSYHRPMNGKGVRFLRMELSLW